TRSRLWLVCRHDVGIGYFLGLSLWSCCSMVVARLAALGSNGASDLAESLGDGADRLCNEFFPHAYSSSCRAPDLANFYVELPNDHHNASSGCAWTTFSAIDGTVIARCGTCSLYCDSPLA